MHLAVFKVGRDRFQDIGAKLLPCLCFGEDSVAQRACVIAAFLRIANLEDQFHSNRIPEVNGGRARFIMAPIATQLILEPATIEAH